MKFYVIEIASGNSKIAGKSIYEYDTLKDATVSFHEKVGTAMSSNLYKTNLVMVINSVGGVHEQNAYVNADYQEEVVSI